MMASTISAANDNTRSNLKSNNCSAGRAGGTLPEDQRESFIRGGDGISRGMKGLHVATNNHNPTHRSNSSRSSGVLNLGPNFGKGAGTSYSNNSSTVGSGSGTVSGGDTLNSGGGGGGYRNDLTGTSSKNYLETIPYLSLNSFPPSHSNSFRTTAATGGGGGGNISQHHAPPPPLPSKGPTMRSSPSSLIPSMSHVGQAGHGGGYSSSAASPLFALTHTAVMTNRDEFSDFEDSLLHEINLLRSDPKRYSVIFEREATVGYPYVCSEDLFFDSDEQVNDQVSRWAAMFPSANTSFVHGGNGSGGSTCSGIFGAGGSSSPVPFSSSGCSPSYKSSRGGSTCGNGGNTPGGWTTHLGGNLSGAGAGSPFSSSVWSYYQNSSNGNHHHHHMNNNNMLGGLPGNGGGMNSTQGSLENNSVVNTPVKQGKKGSKGNRGGGRRTSFNGSNSSGSVDRSCSISGQIGGGGGHGGGGNGNTNNAGGSNHNHHHASTHGGEGGGGAFKRVASFRFGSKHHGANSSGASGDRLLFPDGGGGNSGRGGMGGVGTPRMATLTHPPSTVRSCGMQELNVAQLRTFFLRHQRHRTLLEKAVKDCIHHWQLADQALNESWAAEDSQVTKKGKRAGGGGGGGVSAVGGGSSGGGGGGTGNQTAGGGGGGGGVAKRKSFPHSSSAAADELLRQRSQRSDQLHHIYLEKLEYLMRHLCACRDTCKRAMKGTNLILDCLSALKEATAVPPLRASRGLKLAARDTGQYFHRDREVMNKVFEIHEGVTQRICPSRVSALQLPPPPLLAPPTSNNSLIPNTNPNASSGTGNKGMGSGSPMRVVGRPPLSPSVSFDARSAAEAVLYLESYFSSTRHGGPEGGEGGGGSGGGGGAAALRGSTSSISPVALPGEGGAIGGGGSTGRGKSSPCKGSLILEGGGGGGSGIEDIEKLLSSFQENVVGGRGHGRSGDGADREEEDGGGGDSDGEWDRRGGGRKDRSSSTSSERRRSGSVSSGGGNDVGMISGNLRERQSSHPHSLSRTGSYRKGGGGGGGGGGGSSSSLPGGSSAFSNSTTTPLPQPFSSHHSFLHPQGKDPSCPHSGGFASQDSPSPSPSPTTATPSTLPYPILPDHLIDDLLSYTNALGDVAHEHCMDYGYVSSEVRGVQVYGKDTPRGLVMKALLGVVEPIFGFRAFHQSLQTSFTNPTMTSTMGTSTSSAWTLPYVPHPCAAGGSSSSPPPSSHRGLSPLALDRHAGGGAKGNGEKHRSNALMSILPSSAAPGREVREMGGGGSGAGGGGGAPAAGPAGGEGERSFNEHDPTSEMNRMTIVEYGPSHAFFPPASQEKEVQGWGDAGAMASTDPPSGSRPAGLSSHCRISQLGGGRDVLLGHPFEKSVFYRPSAAHLPAEEHHHEGGGGSIRREESGAEDRNRRERRWTSPTPAGFLRPQHSFSSPFYSSSPPMEEVSRTTMGMMVDGCFHPTTPEAADFFYAEEKAVSTSAGKRAALAAQRLGPLLWRDAHLLGCGWQRAVPEKTVPTYDEAAQRLLQGGEGGNGGGVGGDWRYASPSIEENLVVCTTLVVASGFEELEMMEQYKQLRLDAVRRIVHYHQSGDGSGGGRKRQDGEGRGEEEVEEMVEDEDDGDDDDSDGRRRKMMRMMMRGGGGGRGRMCGSPLCNGARGGFSSFGRPPFFSSIMKREWEDAWEGGEVGGPWNTTLPPPSHVSNSTATPSSRTLFPSWKAGKERLLLPPHPRRPSSSSSSFSSSTSSPRLHQYRRRRRGHGSLPHNPLVDRPALVDLHSALGVSLLYPTKHPIVIHPTECTAWLALRADTSRVAIAATLTSALSPPPTVPILNSSELLVMPSREHSNVVLVLLNVEAAKMKLQKTSGPASHLRVDRSHGGSHHLHHYNHGGGGRNLSGSYRRSSSSDGSGSGTRGGGRASGGLGSSDEDEDHHHHYGVRSDAGDGAVVEDDRVLIHLFECDITGGRDGDKIFSNPQRFSFYNGSPLLPQGGGGMGDALSPHSTPSSAHNPSNLSPGPGTSGSSSLSATAVGGGDSRVRGGTGEGMKPLSPDPPLAFPGNLSSSPFAASHSFQRTSFNSLELGFPSASRGSFEGSMHDTAAGRGEVTGFSPIGFVRLTLPPPPLLPGEERGRGHDPLPPHRLHQVSSSISSSFGPSPIERVGTTTPTTAEVGDGAGRGGRGGGFPLQRGETQSAACSGRVTTLSSPFSLEVTSRKEGENWEEITKTTQPQRQPEEDEEEELYPEFPSSAITTAYSGTGKEEKGEEGESELGRGRGEEDGLTSFSRSSQDLLLGSSVKKGVRGFNALVPSASPLGEEGSKRRKSKERGWEWDDGCTREHDRSWNDNFFHIGSEEAPGWRKGSVKGGGYLGDGRRRNRGRNAPRSTGGLDKDGAGRGCPHYALLTTVPLPYWSLLADLHLSPHAMSEAPQWGSRPGGAGAGGTLMRMGKPSIAGGDGVDGGGNAWSITGMKLSPNSGKMATSAEYPLCRTSSPLLGGATTTAYTTTTTTSSTASSHFSSTRPFPPSAAAPSPLPPHLLSSSSPPPSGYSSTRGALVPLGGGGGRMENVPSSSSSTGVPLVLGSSGSGMPTMGANGGAFPPPLSPPPLLSRAVGLGFGFRGRERLCGGGGGRGGCGDPGFAQGGSPRLLLPGGREYSELFWYGRFGWPLCTTEFYDRSVTLLRPLSGVLTNRDETSRFSVFIPHREAYLKNQIDSIRYQLDTLMRELATEEGDGEEEGDDDKDENVKEDSEEKGRLDGVGSGGRGENQKKKFSQRSRRTSLSQENEMANVGTTHGPRAAAGVAGAGGGKRRKSVDGGGGDVTDEEDEESEGGGITVEGTAVTSYHQKSKNTKKIAQKGEKGSGHSNAKGGGGGGAGGGVDGKMTSRQESNTRRNSAAQKGKKGSEGAGGEGNKKYSQKKGIQRPDSSHAEKHRISSSSSSSFPTSLSPSKLAGSRRGSRERGGGRGKKNESKSGGGAHSSKHPSNGNTSRSGGRRAGRNHKAGSSDRDSTASSSTNSSGNESDWSTNTKDWNKTNRSAVDTLRSLSRKSGGGRGPQGNRRSGSITSTVGTGAGSGHSGGGLPRTGTLVFSTAEEAAVFQLLELPPSAALAQYDMTQRQPLSRLRRMLKILKIEIQEYRQRYTEAERVITPRLGEMEAECERKNGKGKEVNRLRQQHDVLASRLDNMLQGLLELEAVGERIRAEITSRNHMGVVRRSRYEQLQSELMKLQSQASRQHPLDVRLWFCGKNETSLFPSSSSTSTLPVQGEIPREVALSLSLAFSPIAGVPPPPSSSSSLTFSLRGEKGRNGGHSTRGNAEKGEVSTPPYSTSLSKPSVAFPSPFLSSSPLKDSHVALLPCNSPDGTLYETDVLIPEGFIGTIVLLINDQGAIVWRVVDRH